MEECLVDYKLWVFDVDGTFTDSGIYYDNNGNEIKKYCTKDAAGIFALRHLGVKTMILTGRSCYATERRMKELKIDYIFQDIRNKKEFLTQFLHAQSISFDKVAFIGDDVNDIGIMRLCGYKACPADSCDEILEMADYISTKKGGQGAVRDVVEMYLRKNSLWNKTINSIFNI